jgi:4-diphosphocytidyl-2-C-methyl-D-erythritol kinase
MKFEKIKSHAKINLSLNILGKKKSKLHNLETLVGFLDLHDEIFIRKINVKNHIIRFTGNFSNKIPKKNTISNLLKILDEMKKLKNQKYLISIKKNIPKEAGLGGGSMNASSLINYLVKRNKVKLTIKEIQNLCSKIGSDVILGIDQKNLVLAYKNKIKKIKKNLKISTLLIKPNFGCSTKKIYSKVRAYSKPQFSKIKSKDINFNSLSKMKNDLEPISLKMYPRLAKLKEFFLNIDKNSYVRMTGSGSTIVGYFMSKKAALNAKKLLKKKYKNYWCNLSKTI